MKQWIAGVDEAGRGPLAGPVIASCVILNSKHPIPGLTDSKLLSEKEREVLFEEICAKAVDITIGQASVAEIDQFNIHRATLLAMRRAVMALHHHPDKVWVDGKFIPTIPYPAEALVGGDRLMPVISAASIVAKVTRDRLLTHLDDLFPKYGFAKHKGYGTPEHLDNLKKWGPVDSLHRRSFRPVQESLKTKMECTD